MRERRPGGQVWLLHNDRVLIDPVEIGPDDRRASGGGAVEGQRLGSRIKESHLNAGARIVAETPGDFAAITLGGFVHPDGSAEEISRSNRPDVVGTHQGWDGRMVSPKSGCFHANREAIERLRKGKR